MRARAPAGSGLGLAIARRLVEIDGGTIELATRRPAASRPSCACRQPDGRAGPAPVPVLYSVPVPRALTETRLPGRLRRRGPAGALAAAAQRPAARGARGRRRDAAARRPRGAGRLAKLGLRTVGDLLCAPSAPLRAADRRAGDPGSLRRGGGRDRGRRARHDLAPQPRQAAHPHGPGRRRHGRDQGDVVQPAVARGAARPRHPRPPAREAEPLRLPGGELRPRRGDRDRRLRARLPGQRGARPEAAARARRCGARARARRGRSAARTACDRRAAAAPRRRARRAAPAALARGGRGGPPPARLRRAARPPARARPPRRRAGAARGGGAAAAGRAPAALPRGAPVHPHGRAGARDRRDRRRPRADDADAAAAPGRRRLGQDGRRARTRSCAPSRPTGRGR